MCVSPSQLLLPMHRHGRVHMREACREVHMRKYEQAARRVHAHVHVLFLSMSMSIPIPMSMFMFMSLRMCMCMCA